MPEQVRLHVRDGEATHPSGRIDAEDKGAHADLVARSLPAVMLLASGARAAVVDPLGEWRGLRTRSHASASGSTI
jgi:hypothetical protein